MKMILILIIEALEDVKADLWKRVMNFEMESMGSKPTGSKRRV